MVKDDELSYLGEEPEREEDLQVNGTKEEKPV